jgi:hypothetical protein
MRRKHDEQTRKAWAERSTKERGVVLALLALILFALLVFAGLAIDVANWWLTSQSVQRTADSAALGGVVHLPDDFSTAKSIANEVSRRNGYTNGTNATVTVETGDRPTRLKVTVETTTKNFFAGVVGLKTTSIKRHAIADYTGSVPMGSPSDYLGQDPENPARLQKLWLNIAGKGATKVSGDRFTANACDPTVYGCTSSNTEYLTDASHTSNEGYRFVVKVEAVTPNQPLQIQIYDPALIYTGDTCGSNMPSASEVAALQATYANVAPYGTFYNDAATRYAPGSNDFCPGDQDIGGANLNTAYIVRAPDDTPWNDMDNPVVNMSGCQPTNYRPISSSLYKYLDPTNASYSQPDGVYVRANFHRWVTVCSIPAASVVTGDYVLQVRTNALATSPLVYNSSVNTGGHNRYSIRAGFSSGSGAPNGANIKVHANGRLPIYVNAGADSTPTFYLARLKPATAGRNLSLEFFDIGDVGGGASVSMQVLPPTEYGSNFSGCTFKRDNGSTQTSSTCTLSGMTSLNYQGRLVSVNVPIPADYNCTLTTPTGCWVRIQMTFGSGATPTDTTTWSATIDGDPVRLIE